MIRKNDDPTFLSYALLKLKKPITASQGHRCTTKSYNEKFLMVAILAMGSMCAFANENEAMAADANSSTESKLDNVKSFFSDVKYTLSVGMIGRYASYPFDDNKLGLNIGVDAKKNIKSYLEDKVDVYGLVGLHFVQKGGRQSTDFMDILEAGNTFNLRQLSIPIHAGGTYNFKKWQLFLDLGPYMAFKLGGTDIEGLTTKAFDFGFGFNLGCKFKKKFGISLGMDKGFTKIADYEVTSDNDPTGKLTVGDKYSLKGTAAYLRLQWTFGK